MSATGISMATHATTWDKGSSLTGGEHQPSVLLRDGLQRSVEHLSVAHDEALACHAAGNQRVHIPAQRCQGLLEAACISTWQVSAVLLPETRLASSAWFGTCKTLGTVQLLTAMATQPLLDARLSIDVARGAAEDNGLPLPGLPGHARAVVPENEQVCGLLLAGPHACVGLGVDMPLLRLAQHVVGDLQDCLPQIDLAPK